MEDQGGGIADGGGVYTDFAPEQEYALQGIVELGDGSHPLQDGGCFGADVEVLVTSAVSGQSSNPLGQPGLGDAQQTVTLEVTVASTQELPESSQGGDGKALSAQTSQRHEKTKAVDNQPGALIQTEGLCYCLKCYENFEDQDHLTDHLRSHTVATNRLRSPSSGDGARSREKRPRLARRKQNVVGAGSGRGTCGEELSPAQAVKEHDVSCCSGHGDGGERPGHQGDGSAVKAVFCPYRTCRLTFLTSVEMDEHLCDHYPFRCDRCDVMCSSAKLLAQHKKHRCLKTKIFKCELCSFESCGPRDLNKHYSVKHRDKATYACNRCDFISRYRKVLKKHLTMHSDESAEENYEQEERTQEPDNSSFLAQAWPGNQKPSACEEGGLVSETGSEGERSKKNKSFKQRHFKVDVQEGMEHLYKTHICPECKRCFKKRTHLVEHLHLHFPDPSLQCPHCQKFFTSKGKLKVHLMRELGEKTHHCPLCDYSAVEKNSLNRHMASMHENTTNFYSEVYSCPACEEKFTVSNALKEHMKSHKEERRPLDCFEGGCSYTAEERKDFVRHLKQVHGARAVECRYRTCGSLFGSESGMEAHRRTHYAFHCDQCDFVCSNKHVFRRHKRRGHPGSEELACGFCPYKTFNPVDFNDHVGKMHANEKIHKCSECDFATAHKRVLNRHILLHTGEKPHKCELCDFTCRDVGYLSKHRLTHSDDKNYMCTECGYITKWKHYLTVHMRKHTGDLRYHCNQCSYRCHRADQLSSHKLRHQGKSLICEVCGFACKRKYELQKHMQVKHSKDYQMPLHHCQYCSYQTQYKQALLNHENCKHTKLKEFRCALCSYKTFSNTSLFFHKRKVHGYVPGDKDWLENYAKEEMAMNSTQSLLAYSEASLSSAAKSEMAAPPSRNEVQQSEGEEFEKAHQPNVGASAFGRGLLQPGEVSRSRAPLPEEEPLGQHLAYSAKVDGTPEPGENCPDPEKGSNGNSSRLEEVFDAQLGFPSAPAEDMAKQIFVSQLPPLDCWAPCDTGTMYRDLGLNATDIVQADIGNDETDAEHCEEEEDQIVGSQEEVGHNIDVFMEDNQDAGYELSDKTGEPSRKIDDTSASGKANVTCASVAGPQLPQPTDGDNGSPEPQEGKPSGQGSPGGREEDLLSQSELEIKALRKQDKQQAQALVLEGRVQMLVVQTDAQVFKCEGCSYITRKEKAMVLHTKSGCQSRKMPLVCTACGATFKQLRGLSTHVQKKCPVILKKHKLYTRQATVKLPATRLDGEAEPAADARAEGVPVLSKGEDQQVNIGQRKQREPGLDADKPTQLLSKTASVSGVELRDQDAAQPVRVPEEGNIAQVRPAAGEEGDVFRTLAEKALDVASLLNGESLPSSPGEVERSQQELGTAKFTFAQGKYSCASCPFACSSKLAISSHVAGGCPAPLKLPCGLCELLFRSERVLKNHRAIKHAEEREVPSEESEVNKASYSSEGEEGSGKEDSPEESSGDSGADHGARRRRFTCPSCPFSCYQERAMDTHRRKGCMKPGELQCGLCSFVCKSAAALKHHVRLHGKRACRRRPRLSCELCPFTCKQLRCLQQHIAIKHDGVKPHKCSYCDFSTTRRYRLDAHESLHTGVGRLACDACQQTFGTGSKLRIHKLRVHEKRPTHFCALCDYSGYNQNDITRHASSCHAGEPSAACGRCQARFSSAGALKQHCLRRHEERGGHGCPSCVFACRSRSTLRSHVQRQHPQLVCAACKQHFPGREELEEHRKVHFGHRCQHCPFATRERQQLIQHLLDRHEEEGGEGGGGKPFRCPFCSFACRHQLVFDYHMKAHGGTRLYKCTDCDYTTKNRQKITWHIRIHTGEKPYKCHLCNYACADPSRLKYHMRIHQEERKYLCPDCGYKCKWINQLKYHMTKHTGAKPYQCDQCEYCTNRADALRTHKETRHKETRSFICEQCGKGFKTRFLLKTHLKKHSEEKPYVCSVCHRGFRWQAGLRHHHLTHTNQHPFFCRHCSYKAKQKFQVVKHIQRHHPLKASGNPSEGVGKVPVTHALGTCDGGTAEPLDSAGVNGLVSSS